MASSSFCRVSEYDASRATDIDEAIVTVDKGAVAAEEGVVEVVKGWSWQHLVFVREQQVNSSDWLAHLEIAPEQCWTSLICDPVLRADAP